MDNNLYSLSITNKRIDDLREEIVRLSNQIESIKKIIWIASGFFSAVSFFLSLILK